MFASNEAAEIGAIYVSRIDLPDELVWHYDKKGHYTVKSGYRVSYDGWNTFTQQEMV